MLRFVVRLQTLSEQVCNILSELPIVPCIIVCKFGKHTPPKPSLAEFLRRPEIAEYPDQSTEVFAFVGNARSNDRCLPPRFFVTSVLGEDRLVARVCHQDRNTTRQAGELNFEFWLDPP